MRVVWGTQAGTWRQESAPEGGGGCWLVHSQDPVYLALLYSPGPPV